ncbi:MAG TPA: UDP-N-acetylglucosamine--N-acetylmuramyl-(pentapeptide) pyrophosphoryl-undecaprenol N-acetylglucosamine transferase [Candidatus Paceibacterota bacterium]|nr:UDP-N-acetylglucosamine--N-acetylmuramyl-(pentapeptide) pyrophosphoryl-undecaprenol N-acetylglucosamine transferase [Candidatus Paceibacterota bacterium]
MTIAFAGGGTGGHFYPNIAIAESIQDLVRKERLIAPRLYYLAPSEFDPQALYENEIQFIRIPAGKLRRYKSFANYTDALLTFWGVITAVLALFRIYPDVVVSKGGYASVPVAIAARILAIPLIIHESDAKPGRANLLAAKWAKSIAVSYASAEKFFPAKVRGKIARTGIPVRRELAHLETEGAKQYLQLDESVPTVLVLGGSSGSERINETLIAALPALVGEANLIHQCGKAHLRQVELVAKVALQGAPHAARYHPADYLDALTLRRAAGAADLVVSRAGATAIAEIARWGKPAILIPIPESVSHDQRANAYAYAELGAAIVLEEGNLTPHLLVSEIKRILGDRDLAAKMAAAGKSFVDADAAAIIAKEAVDIALSHE